MEKIKVLYIDDERINLLAFKSSFRRIFDIHVAPSAEEGLKILQNYPIEVVIADQRMPGTTGVDFFESILSTHKNPIRILLTGYSDINAIIDAINKGHVYQYVTKPWNEYELKLTIENAYHLYQLKEQNSKLTTKYQKVFSECADPIILLDTKARIIDYNKATLDLFQFKETCLNLIAFNSFMNDKNDIKTIVKTILEKGFIRDFECQIRAKDNVIRNCLVSVNQITNSYGEIISYQAIIKDITEKSKISQLLLKTAIETQENERERISKDLHDGVGQSLAAIKLHLEVLKMGVEKNDTNDNEFETIKGLIKNSIVQLRNICFDTLPPVLSDYGLIKAVQGLTQKSSTTNFQINFSHSDTFPALDKSLEIAMYRIIQEFINNTIKHGQASNIFINIQRQEDSISLCLKDDGIGFNINNLLIYEGQGLKNIKSRVESFNGQVNFNSAPNEGTEFGISIPLDLTETQLIQN